VDLPFSTRPVNPALVPVLEKLRPGQHIRITHLVRVGSKTWPAVVTGTFRDLNSLATGIATDRVPADDIIVPVIHFTKENQEHSSIALDEHTKVEILDHFEAMFKPRSKSS
jgi:hypothetical protein